MTIPKTYSAPPDETYPGLKGYVPSKEDALRYAVWLMLVADDVNRATHSNDPSNPAAGVNIFQCRPEYDAGSLAIKRLPCQIVDTVVGQSTWLYATSRAGELAIVIGVACLEPVDTSTVRTDPDAPSLTMETKLDRVRRILMRGTLWKEGMETGDGKVIDPYRTARKEDGSYDMSTASWLSLQPPEIRPASRVKFPNTNKPTKTAADLLQLDPVRDFAVSFGWLAKYPVVVNDRDTM